MGVFQKLRQIITPDSNSSLNRLQDKSQVKSHEDIPIAEVTVSQKCSSYYVDVVLADGESISRVNLGYKSESGGYVNWAVYSVRGKNVSTNRINTRKYQAKSKETATDMAKADGLIGPYEIVCLPHPDEQSKIDYFKAQLSEYGVFPPAGSVVDDLRDILNRVRYSDDVVSEEWVAKDRVVRRVRPIEGPNVEFAKYADSMGLKFSTYISGPGLFAYAVQNLPKKEKVALFAYCVLCSQHKEAVGNLRKSEYAEQIYRFADMAVNDQEVYKSIVGRDLDDYLKPHKGSKAYKSVASFFGL